MSEKVIVTRDDAIKLMSWIGFGASAWDNDRLAGRLESTIDMVDPDKEKDESIAMIMLTVTAAIEEGLSFTVVDSPADSGVEDTDVVITETAPPKLTRPKSTRPTRPGKTVIEFEGEQVEFVNMEPEEEAIQYAPPEGGDPPPTVEETTPEVQIKEPAKPKKPKKRRRRKRVGVPGVIPTKTRGYFAGRVIKKYGLAAGVTDDMVKEVNKLFGTKNDRESRMRLVFGWHALNAYLEEVRIKKF